MSAKLDELVSLAKAAAAEAANYQERFAAEDTEARKIVDIMERFLRVKAVLSMEVLQSMHISHPPVASMTQISISPTTIS